MEITESPACQCPPSKDRVQTFWQMQEMQHICEPESQRGTKTTTTFSVRLFERKNI